MILRSEQVKKSRFGYLAFCTEQYYKRNSSHALVCCFLVDLRRNQKDMMNPLSLRQINRCSHRLPI